jgi:phosphohistidine phosphatase
MSSKAVSAADGVDSLHPEPAFTRVVLVRHGKSDWDSPPLADHERPLKKRGRQDAQRLGEWITEQKLEPGLVLCSPALRTRQTLETMMSGWSLPSPCVHDPRLYLASRTQLLECLDRNAELNPDPARPILMVGHNPGLEDLLIWWAGDADGAGSARRMPTAACATFEAVAGRSPLAAGGMRLLSYRLPS